MHEGPARDAPLAGGLGKPVDKHLVLDPGHDLSL